MDCARESRSAKPPAKIETTAIAARIRCFTFPPSSRDLDCPGKWNKEPSFLVKTSDGGVEPPISPDLRAIQSHLSQRRAPPTEFPPQSVPTITSEALMMA